MTTKAQQQSRQGFVIVGPKGVFLGSGRWSSEHNRVKRAPVYATEDEEVLKNVGAEGAEYRAVELSTSPQGFADRKELEGLGVQWGGTEEETPERETVAGAMGGESEKPRRGRRSR